MPGVAVVLPFRGGCEHREAALQHVLHLYRRHLPRACVIVAADHAVGPWCKARAVAQTRAALDGAEIVVVADGDVWAPSLPATIRDVHLGREWGAPHATVRRLTQAASHTVYAGGVGDEISEPVRPAVLGGGIVVLRRDVFDDCPLDPGFHGWGGEDVAWGFALRTLHPDFVRGSDELTHFWHPPAPRRSRACGSPSNERLREEYRAALTMPDRMRALLAEAT